MKATANILTAAAFCTASLLAPASLHARDHNLNVSFTGSGEHCSDLKVTSGNGQVAQAAESFTLSRSEAPTLELRGLERGVLRVRGQDRADYAVEVCKVAAAGDRASAEQLVRAISVSRSAGRIAYSGPSDGDSDWQVYFIVHAPRNGNLDAETKNGPIDIADMNGGTLKVRATNGPVSLRNCSANMDVETQNGPVSFSGGGGDVRIAAHNGPVAVELSGDVWNGPRLDASTVNGPVSLVVPDTFRSGVRLETSGYAPVACASGACKGAWSDTSSGKHVMQLNGSHDTVRLSTTNGPVVIHAPKGPKII